MAVNYNFIIDEKDVTLNQVDEAICNLLEQPVSDTKYSNEYQYITYLAIPAKSNNLSIVDKHTDFNGLQSDIIDETSDADIAIITYIFDKLNLQLHIY